MKQIFVLFFLTLYLHASNALNLEEALSLLTKNNLELKAASLDISIAQEKSNEVNAKNWGKLDFIQDVSRSNDAGNVFGFKLTSREANFGDFGAEEFMNNYTAGKNPYSTPPNNLNYPDDRNFFQSKLRYEVPLFTGFALSSYSDIMNKMVRIKSLNKKALLSEKRYELKKSYYDMALLESSLKHLNIILHNIERLENTTKSMIDVGYAKHTDLLEVEAKKGNVERLLFQMSANEKLLYHYISFLLNTPVTKIRVPSSDMIMLNMSDKDILSRNIDIQKASTGLQIRSSMLESKKSLYYPTVGAFAEVATADDTFLGDANDHKAYTVGARLTWNIFSGGEDSAKIEEASLEKLKMQTQLQLAKQGIALKLAKIRTEIESSNDEIASLIKELALADAIYKNYEGRYREKLSSMSDVIIKQSQQIEKILLLQQAKNKRNKEIISLEKLANQGE